MVYNIIKLSKTYASNEDFGFQSKNYNFVFRLSELITHTLIQNVVID